MSAHFDRSVVQHWMLWLRASVLWSAVGGAMTQGSRRRALPWGKYPKNENQNKGGLKEMDIQKGITAMLFAVMVIATLAVSPATAVVDTTPPEITCLDNVTAEQGQQMQLTSVMLIRQSQAMN
jgi:hypothetical protein